MRSIAEFVMRGRLQALLVAVPGAGTGIFFWLSAAVIALVTLRKGVEQGGFILLWSLLPAGLLAWKVDPLPLLCIVAAFVVAAVLRQLVRWDLALLAGVAVSLAVAVMLQFGFQDYLQDYLTLYLTELEKVQASMPDNSELTAMLSGITTSQLAGIFAVLTSLFALLAVIVGRYWQSLLYNDGGFGEEFRALRFSPIVVAVLVLMAMVLYSTTDYKLWSWLCLLPLVLMGVALVHAVVYSGKGSKSWLIFFYILLIFGPMKELLCVVAVADSMLNFRARLRQQP